MAKAGTAYVDFEGKFDKLNKQVAAQVAPLSGRFGKLGKAAAVGLAGIGTAAIGVGAGLYKIGESFDDAYDTIRVKTGATGKQLGGLQKDFRNVVRSVPTDFASASRAVAEINQRLDVTGKPLRSLSKQFLELSRITETDLGQNIEAVTRAFGDWGIETQKQPAYLDKLFRASQKTGVPVDRLAQTITKFGGPLRQLGFNFDQAAAMAGKFEKEGVNTELVLGSMRIALGKMAREGEAPASTLRRVTNEIKNAGDSGKANALALELFGARAGPDMAAAIREGRFEIDSLVRGIRNGRDTITGAGKDTQDFGEKWQIVKNKTLVALEPLAIRVFDAIGNGMDRLSKVDFTAAFSKVKAFIQPLSSELTRIFNDPSLSIGQKIAKSLGASGSFIADAAAKAFAAAAPRAGQAFVTAFQNTSALGKLFIIAGIAGKLGAFQVMGQMAAAKFAGGFSRNLKFAGVIGGALALVGALTSLTGSTKSAARASEDLTDALEAERNAMKRVRDLDLDAAQARNTVKQSAIAVEQAERELSRTRQSSGRNSLAARQAEANLQAARIQHKREVRALRDVEGDAAQTRLDANKATRATILAQYEADKSTLGWAEAAKRLKDRIEALPPSRDIKITADTSSAMANVQALIAAINSGVARAQDLINRARQAKELRSVSNAELLFGLEADIAGLQVQLTQAQARQARDDVKRQRNDLENAISIAKARTVTKDFTKGDKAKEIRDTTRVLREFNAEQKLARDRAKELRGFEVKIANKQKLIDLRNALRDVRGELDSKMSDALGKFQDQWEKSIGKALDKTNAATLDAFDKATEAQITSGPAAQALAALEAESVRIAAEQEDAANAKELAEAMESKDAARIAEAQARIDETNRQRQITAAQKAAEDERAAIVEAREAERKALEEAQQAEREARYTADTEAFKGALAQQLADEYAQLEGRKQNYAQFAKDVNAILAANGLTGINVTPDIEAAINNAPQPKAPGTGKGKNKGKGKAKASTARALAAGNTLATNVTGRAALHIENFYAPPGANENTIAARFAWLVDA